SQTFSTEYNTYFGGGYNYQLRGSLLEIIGDLSELENTSWFDRNTRAIFLTFNLYNPNVNLFIYCSLLMEYLPSMGYLILELHLLRFNCRFTLLWLTLQKAKDSLIGFT
ncbi:unnamed protein product, partial [Rotaria sp. Silwood1]